VTVLTEFTKGIMYIDQDFVAGAGLFPPTSTAAPLLPTGAPTPTPLPTVVPTIPTVHFETIGDAGKITLWVVCVIMGLTSLGFYALAARVPVQKRLFHVITSFITTFAFLSYFAMATGDGNTYQTSVLRETEKRIVTEIWHRQIFWARYVDWVVTTPLLLLDLSLLAGLNGASILITIVADVIMVLTGLFAALGKTGSQTWGWYAIACVAFLVVVYQLAQNGSRAVANKDNKTKTFFRSLGGFTLVLWSIYPIIWAVADGARIININGEVIAYAVLDILAKPVFGIWLLTAHDKKARSSPTLEGFWAHGASTEGALRVGDDQD
jgi:bacteriorhodopsin